MGIGVSVFLLAVGAVLAFAVHATVAGLDIHVVGWILMAAGALGLVMTLAIFAPRSRRMVTQTRTTPTPAGAAILGSSVPEGSVVNEVRNDVI